MTKARLIVHDTPLSNWGTSIAPETVYLHFLGRIFLVEKSNVMAYPLEKGFCL